MEIFVSFCSFVGSWLLVAGPIYQASLELRDQAIETERLERLKAISEKTPHPPQSSPWWWFLPPVKLYLERRNSQRYRRRYLAALDPDDYDALTAFFNKATAWFYVSLGGLLLAAKETYELSQHYHLNMALYWIIMVVMLILSIFNTIGRILRNKHRLDSDGTRSYT